MCVSRLNFSCLVAFIACRRANRAHVARFTTAGGEGQDCRALRIGPYDVGNVGAHGVVLLHDGGDGRRGGKNSSTRGASVIHIARARKRIEKHVSDI